MTEVKCALECYPDELTPINKDGSTQSNIEQQNTVAVSSDIPNKPRNFSRNVEERLTIIALVICTIALFLDIGLSFSSRNWYERDETIDGLKTTTTVGLWKACVDKESSYYAELTDTECWNHDEKGFPFSFTFVGATQAFQCLGLIFLGFAIIATSTKLIILEENDLLIYIAGIHALWAGVCFAASAAVVRPGLKRIHTLESFTDDIDYTKYIKWGCDLSYLSSAIALIGGMILLLNKRLFCICS